MLKSLGFMVRKLVRLRIGAYWLNDLKMGKTIHLDPSDIDLLHLNPPMDRIFYTKPKATPNAKRAKRNTKSKFKKRRK